MVWQGEVQLEFVGQQVGDPGHRYRLAVQPTVRSRPVPASALGALTTLFAVTWPGGTAVTVPARLDKASGDFTAQPLVPARAGTGSAHVTVTAASPGVQGQAATSFPVRPGGGLTVTLDLPRGKRVAPGTSVTANATIDTNGAPATSIVLSLGGLSDGVDATIAEPSGAIQVKSGRQTIPVTIGFGKPNRLGPALGTIRWAPAGQETSAPSDWLAFDSLDVDIENPPTPLYKQPWSWAALVAVLLAVGIFFLGRRWIHRDDIYLQDGPAVIEGPYRQPGAERRRESKYGTSNGAAQSPDGQPTKYGQASGAPGRAPTSTSPAKSTGETSRKAPIATGPAKPAEPRGLGMSVLGSRRRYLKGQCPEQWSVGEPFSLLVSIVAAGSVGSELKPFDVPTGGQDVLLVAHAPGMQLLGHQRLNVRVPADGDSEPVMFELRADEPGPRSISVTAWLGGSYLGELLVEITAERGQAGGPHREFRAEIAAEASEGAVSLVVRYDPDLKAYRFEFRDEDNPDEVVSKLSFEPRQRIERLVADLDRLAAGRSGYSADQARDYLVNAGAELWRELVPPGLREQFWDRQHRIRQLTILADKDTVPWELLYPKDPGHDAGFLVQQFPVTRGIFGRRPAPRLSLWPARFVLPRGSLPEAEAEIDAMRRLLDPAQAPGGRRLGSHAASGPDPGRRLRPASFRLP